MPRTSLVFDVNETLLDLSALDAVFDAMFDRPHQRQAWFTRMLHWSTVTTLTGRFMDFSLLAGYCLDQLAAEQGVTLGSSPRDSVFQTIATLAPHPEVVDSLQSLRHAGFSLTALTNSGQSTVDAQFAHAGMTELFDHVLSIDSARCYKPHPNAYAVATTTLGVRPEALRLIACHDWDVTGALRAGLAAAFVARGGATLNGAGEEPDIIGRDLADVAEQIIQSDG